MALPKACLADGKKEVNQVNDWLDNGEVLPEYIEIEDDFLLPWTIKKEPSDEEAIDFGYVSFSKESPGRTSPEVLKLTEDQVDTDEDQHDDDVDDSHMAQRYYCNVKTEGLKKPRHHPYADKVAERGKKSVKGKTRIKSSGKKTKKTRTQIQGRRPDSQPSIMEFEQEHFMSEGMNVTDSIPMMEHAVLSNRSTPNVNPDQFAQSTQSNPSLHYPHPAVSPRVPDVPPPLECEACHVLRSHNSIIQCCEGHVVCTLCVEKEAKLVIVGSKKGSVACSVVMCTSSIPQSELRKSLPSIVVDLLEESWKKETLEAIENMKDGVKCPNCDYFGVLDANIKNFTCVRCQKTYCRLCQLEWHLKSHNLCIKMTKRVSEATGHTINIPAHWMLDTDTEKEIGYSVEDLSPTSEEYLDTLTQFTRTLGKNSHYQVNKIYRVQNQRLWEKYSLFRTHMIEDIGETLINEERLFHGTKPDVIDSICKEGFDWRLSGKHGTVFGHGSYFAKDSKYSAKYSAISRGYWKPPVDKKQASTSGPSFPPSYTQSLRFNVLTEQPPQHPVPYAGDPVAARRNFAKHTPTVVLPLDPLASTSVNPSHGANIHSTGKSFWDVYIEKNGPGATSSENLVPKQFMYMFVGRVIVGRKCIGHSEMRRPEKDAQGQMCHTAVDNIHNSRIYVVFESGQCYPEYLIEFIVAM